MPFQLPSMTLSAAQKISRDVVKLTTDYWILEGSFSKTSMFASGKDLIETLMSMEKSVLALVKSLEEKSSTLPFDTSSSEYTVYRTLNSDLAIYKKILTDLRIKLEGNTWYNYDHEVIYQIIGNQPNPGQSGQSVPKRRKSTRTTKAKPVGVSKISKSCAISIDDAAKSLIALATATNAKELAKMPTFNSSFTLNTPSPLGAIPESVASQTLYPIVLAPVGSDPKDQHINQLEIALADAEQKQREHSKDFIRTIVNYDNDIIELEKKIRDIATAHRIEIATKNQIIADKEGIIANKNEVISQKDILIKKYALYLEPYGVKIKANGELKLGVVGNQSFAEDS